MSSISAATLSVPKPAAPAVHTHRAKSGKSQSAQAAPVATTAAKPAATTGKVSVTA